MRILTFTTPLVGHLNPMVPLLWSLRAQGHELVVSAPEDFAGQVVRRGLPAHASEAVSVQACMSTDRAGRPVPPDHDPVGRLTRSGRGWGRLAAAQVAECTELVGRWDPDVVVADSVHHAGPLAAAAHDVPWIEHGWGIWPAREFQVAATAELAPELDARGLDRLPEPAARLDVCAAPLQAAREASVPMRYVPVGGLARHPAWLDEPRPRPVICVTFGTMLPALPGNPVLPLMGELMRTLPGIGCDVVVAVDPRHAERLPRGLPGVLDVGWLPLDEVLPHCAAIVHYAASGTIMSALVAGVPQVVVPIPVADAPANALVLEAAGLARLVDGHGVEAETVAAACRDVLADTELRARVSLMSAHQRSRPTPAEIARRLPDLVG